MTHLCIHPPPKEPAEVRAKECMRHPDFDATWAQHKNLVFWWAKKAAQVFGGHYRKYLGTILIRFNRVLWSWDPAKKAKLSTYFSINLLASTAQDFLRYESESRAIYWFNTHTTVEDKKQVFVKYISRELDHTLYRCPEKDEDWALELIDFMGGPAKMWEFITRNLNPRKKAILELRYRHGLRYHEIGEGLGISKQRVMQILNNTLDHVKYQFTKIEGFARLFASEFI